MPFRPLAAEAARWMTFDAEHVAEIVEEILREEAWWAAARTCKYAQSRVVWADRAGDTISSRASVCSRRGCPKNR